MLSQFRSTGFFKTAVQGLKEQLELRQYKKISAFRRYVLDVAQKELQDTDISFTYGLLKRGRAYKMVEFRFSREERASRPLKYQGEGVMAESPKDSVHAPMALHPEEEATPDTRTLYQRLQEDRRLSHQQIIGLFELGYKAIVKALYDIKNNIRDRGVANKAGYTMKCFEAMLESAKNNK